MNPQFLKVVNVRKHLLLLCHFEVALPPSSFLLRKGDAVKRGIWNNGIAEYGITFNYRK